MNLLLRTDPFRELDRLTEQAKPRKSKVASNGHRHVIGT